LVAARDPHSGVQKISAGHPNSYRAPGKATPESLQRGIAPIP
jgi:hypothetical protein